MTEINDDVAADEEIVAAPEIVEPDPEQLKAEEEAKKYGWRAKEAFDKDQAGWVDAKRFLELPSTQLKQARDERREATREMEERLRRQDAMAKLAMDKALEIERANHARELAEVQAQRRNAAEIGDMAAFDKLATAETEALKRTMAPEPIREPEPAQEDAVKRTLDEYTAKNEWARDPYLWSQAVHVVNVAPHMLGKPVNEQLAFAEARMRELFPHKFPQAVQKQVISRVDGGGLGGQSRAASSDLPPEAQAAGAEFVKQGIFKSMEDYAKAYRDM